MTREEFIGKLQMVYVGDKRATEEIISEYDRLNNKVSELENINEKIGLALNSSENKVDRLNNIINELEKWLEESIEKHTDDYIDWKYDRNVYLAGSKKLQNVFDKLQELKGSDSNE